MDLPSSAYIFTNSPTAATSVVGIYWIPDMTGFKLGETLSRKRINTPMIKIPRITLDGQSKKVGDIYNIAYNACFYVA